MFPPGKSARKIWDFEITRFPGIVCRDLGNFFYISKDFRGTDIHHSDIKKCVSANFNFFFCLLKIVFRNSQKLLRQNACEIKILF